MGRLFRLGAGLGDRRRGALAGIVVEGKTPGEDREQAVAVVRPWADAGVAWWIETMCEAPGDPDGSHAARTRIVQRPPRID